MASTTPKPRKKKKKVSFMIEKNNPAGFSYSPSREKSYLSQSGDDKVIFM